MALMPERQCEMLDATPISFSLKPSLSSFEYKCSTVPRESNMCTHQRGNAVPVNQNFARPENLVIQSQHAMHSLRKSKEIAIAAMRQFLGCPFLIQVERFPTLGTLTFGIIGNL
jgi:hypothetical protein